VLVCCAIAADSSALLCLLPALLLACVLTARRYPGERVLIARSSRRRRHWPRARSARNGRAHARALTAAAHGGLLIARSLAVRPPPARVRAIA
jgi:hypothetical protein